MTINLTEKVKANWSVISLIAAEVKQAKEAEKAAQSPKQGA